MLCEPLRELPEKARIFGLRFMTMAPELLMEETRSAGKLRALGPTLFQLASSRIGITMVLEDRADRLVGDAA